MRHREFQQCLRNCPTISLGPESSRLLEEVGMQISKIMHREVKIIDPNETLRDAAAAMKKLDGGVLPVGEHDKMVGMITDRHIAIRGIAEGKEPDTKAREVMSR